VTTAFPLLLCGQPYGERASGPVQGSQRARDSSESVKPAFRETSESVKPAFRETSESATPAMERPAMDATNTVFRNGTVLTMDAGRQVLTGCDVLVVGDRIEAVGPALAVPEGTVEVDAGGGIVMPGMIDTHRHMWQTAMRGYGADWTLTQYFVWYYLEHGKIFRPEDIYAGNVLSAIESLDAGVTTTVDWSHGLQTTQHADAAADALESVAGRFVLAYGNIQAGPWQWSATPEFRDFVERRTRDKELLGFQMAFDVTGDAQFPEKAAFEVARDLGVTVTTHAGVWGATNDDGIRLMYENGFMVPGTVYVHAATLNADSYQRIAATGGSVSVATESEQSCGQGYPPSWVLRNHDIPVSLSMDTSVWWSGDLFSAMRSTLGADRSRMHLAAHAKGETVTHSHLRAEHVVEYATLGGAKALGLDDRIGSLEPGKKADVVLLKNDASPVMFPVLNPYGHVAFQAQRADVHTVLVNGRTVKRDGKLVDVDLPATRRLIESTVDYLRTQLGADEWRKGMNPDIPATKVLDNPYQYTDYRSDSTHGG
jgi:cytosine/adenosine deaminase-related metal-dependent hydrolase